ncbi:sulfotransferase-like domain-containing protein [Hyphococcus lacteus]|uniref:HAD family hydrolase n=1 Tax=Hyphococcus lacteus TaxID=3143536 RepID=A0ABV3Z5Q5_9PROT
MTSTPTRIIMLSGPRNISTTMMRSFESRPDTTVIDEPFYASYLKSSGANHPMREEIISSQPSDWETAIENLRAPALSGHSYVFEKHIAFHLTFAPDFRWLNKQKMFHLIRHPAAMVASYKNKLDDVAPISHSYEIQREIYQRAPAPIVDAADILRNPAEMLEKLCDVLGLEFSKHMLSWPTGVRNTDGIWAAHWYDAVVNSTGFLPYTEKGIALSGELDAIAKASMDDYCYFYERRLQV